MKALCFVFGLLLASPAFAAPGDLDPTFDGDGIAQTTFDGFFSFTDVIALEGNGKIVAVGGAADPNFTDTSFALARYNPDGSLDTGFGTEGRVVLPISGQNDQAPSGMELLLSDGKILVVGESGTFQDSDLMVLRLNNDGEPDDSFGTGGFAPLPVPGTAEFASGVGVRGDGKIVIGGTILVNDMNDDLFLARLNEDGSPDSSFDGDGFAVISVGDDDSSIFNSDFALLENEKMLMVANINLEGGPAVFRFNPDGSLDTSFDGDGILPLPDGVSARSMALDPDGNILVGADNAPREFVIVRYLPDGTLDTTFDGDGVVNLLPELPSTGVFGFAFQENGKILAGGTTFDGTDSFGTLARFNPDGSLDTDFGGDGIVVLADSDSNISSIALQSDGKIVVEAFLEPEGFAVARLEGDAPPPSSGGCELVR